MKFTVITGFPEFFQSFLSTSIVGRAVQRGLIEVDVVDLRQYGEGGYRQIDDYSFGGRGGMTMMCEPLQKALDGIDSVNAKVLFPSPQGAVLTQDLVESLAREKHLIVICGHYEGMDERFVKKRVDLELSIGDYVLTGGELPTMVLIDALSRLVPGVVGKTLSVTDDSFYGGMLDTPHFTRPALWESEAVPEVLLSGKDADIQHWRRRTAAARTLSRRPDLLSRANVMDYLDDEVYLGLQGDPLSAEFVRLLTQVSATASAYGVVRTVVAPLNPTDFGTLRSVVGENIAGVKLVPSVRSMVEWVERKKHGRVFQVAAEMPGGIPWLEAKRQMLESTGPVLVLFGGHPDSGRLKCEMRPLEPGSGQRPQGSLVSAVLDRFFGSR